MKSFCVGGRKGILRVFFLPGIAHGIFFLPFARSQFPGKVEEKVENLKMFFGKIRVFLPPKKSSMGKRQALTY